MASLILNGGSSLLGLGAFSIPLQLALFHWQRCSEFSCDRAAAICMRGSDSVVNTMIRLAGGKKELTDKIDIESYLQQAEDYNQLIGTSSWNKVLQYLVLMNRSHPFLSVRASEIKKWCESDDFKRLLDYADEKTGVFCSHCGSVIEENWKFCRKCGKEI
jgi:Zn-dependent protease with chaperone function